nr:uncharacterized protein LOC113696535 [Coffea arabica]
MTALHTSGQNELRQRLQEEVKKSNSRLETVVGNLDQRFCKLEQKFSALMQVMLKDKGVQENEGGSSEPLLPTPPSYFRLATQAEIAGHQQESRGRMSTPNLPRLELPMFSARNPREWLRKCHKYFLNYQIPASQKVDLVEMFLEGKADNWFQGVKLAKPGLNWEEFSELLCERFSGKGSLDIVEEFNKLQQVGTVEEYEEKFEKLKTLMLTKNPKLDESYFVFSFISGLKEEIKPMVKMFRPQTLTKAFEVAELQEYALEVQCKQTKNSGKVALEPKFGIYKGQIGGQNLPSTYKLPAITSNTRKTEVAHKEVGRLSAEELQYRRKNNLCYRCGEKFGMGHQCRAKGLNCLSVEEEEETDFEDAVGEQDELTGRVGEMAEVSLNALFGAIQRKSIMLIGSIEGLPVKILVDTGSSDSFINHRLVTLLHLPYQSVNSFTVTLANGTDITSGAACPKVAWRIQDYQFQFDMKIMELGSWDIILGVDWMCQFSPITFDFHTLSIALSDRGQLLHLQGFINQPTMELMRGRDLRSFIQEKKRSCAHLQANSTKDLQKDISELVEQVLQQFSQIFATPTGLPPERELDHQITLKPGAEPFKLKPYRYPHSHKAEIEKQVAEMLTNGIVKHSTSPFASPVLLVKKKNTWRLCIDYRRLNEVTVKDRFPIPNIDELLDELHGTKYMSKLDLRAGPTLESYAQHLKVVLQVLADNQLYCKKSKCSFAQTSMEYLGHVISDVGVSMDPDKVGCILSWPTPSSVKELRGFLGLTGYYRRFIRGYGVICKPLTQLLKKESFGWNHHAQMAFEDLKRAMTTAPVLSMPDFEILFVIETDARGLGIGAVSMQHGHPIAFLGKALSSQNLGLFVYEKELFALVLAVTKWKHYLVGHHFVIKTDHQALKHLLEQKLTHPLQHKWLTKLLGLDYEIQYKKGADNGVADALSRRRFEDPLEDMAVSHTMYAISSVQPAWMQELVASYEGDNEAQQKIAQLLLDPNAVSDYHLDRGMLKFKDKLYVGSANSIRGKRSKHENVPYPGLLQPIPVPQQAWSHVSMDFIEQLPLSHGFDTILVVVDRLTKFSHFIRLTHPFIAQQIAQVFLDQIYRLHGLPESVISDRDRTFVSRFWQELFHLLGVGLHYSSSYHPQSDSQTELWYNTNFHTSLQITPFEALYGYKPNHIPLGPFHDSIIPAAANLVQDRLKVISLIKKNLAKAQSRMKHFTDRHRSERALQIIAKVGAVAYKLQLPDGARIHPVFHVSLLKKRIGDAQGIDPMFPAWDSSDQYLLQPEKILKRRATKRNSQVVIQYLVKWDQLPESESSWEDKDFIDKQFPEFQA